MANIATTALLLACGCKPEHLDEAVRVLGPQHIPETHVEAYDQAMAAIETVEARH
jgi:hypothetical protein